MRENISEITLVLIAGSVIVLLLAVVMIFSLFTNQKRKFRHQQQLQEQKKIFEQEILRVQMEIQAQTFETISHELHDNVSNTLSVALLNLNLLTPGPESVQRLTESKQLILEAKQAVKDFSWLIDPENIHRIGLLRSLQELTDRFKRSKIMSVNYEVNGEEFPIESARQIIIYRIVQESLGNILKHAGSPRVELKIVFEDPCLRIVIQDHGCGFDLKQISAQATEHRGSGLKNMITRAYMINAELDIDSIPGKGTAITLNYPSETHIV